MPKLTWDNIGEKLYETGTSNAVLYPVNETGAYPKGIAWNGLTGVEENPSGGEATKIYADDIIYGVMYSKEEYGATIKAYTYPDEFAECDGSAELEAGITIGQQTRKGFGLVYKTKIGNDVKGEDYGYKLHVVYGCRVSPSSRSNQTINDSPSALEFSWEVTTTPVNVTGHAPTSTLVIDSTKVTPTALTKIEEALFGNSTEGVAHLPLPDELLALAKEQ